MLTLIIQWIYIASTPFLFLKLGRIVYARITKTSISNPALEFVLGLLSFIILSFFLRFLGAPWIIAILAPLLPAFFLKQEKITYRFQFKSFLHPNFILWTLTHVILGASLFHFQAGYITTPWANNYSDLTFHLGSIFSFAIGENTKPAYHVFAGQIFSYPFLVNFWSACYLWIHPSITSLKYIFAFQWVLLWSLVYVFLKGNRFFILPWAILLGGGAFSFSEIGTTTKLFFWNASHQTWAFSWERLGKGTPFSVFLTTVWVTQRSALFGLACLLAALKNGFENQTRAGVAITGLIFASMALVHAHFALLGATFFGLHILLKKREKKVPYVMTYICCLSLGCIFLPWLLGKAGVASIVYGWMLKGKFISLGSFLSAWTHFWYRNAGVLIVLFLSFLLCEKKRKPYYCLIALFLVANFVNLSIWKWDQIKVFIALYCMFMFLISQTKQKLIVHLHALIIILFLPALNEVTAIKRKNAVYTSYTAQHVAVADSIKKHTNPRAIIAAAPKHNSPVTLTGRTLFYGYEGTLWSHSISYKKRRYIMKNLNKLIRCKEFSSHCPEFLVWTHFEQRYWRRDSPPEAFEKIDDNLYRFPEI